VWLGVVLCGARVVWKKCGRGGVGDPWLWWGGQYFVMLGAGSAMGPFLTLMALGANVIAIDLDL
jgi:hypothetical protein